jgi:hypothetical protein
VGGEQSPVRSHLCQRCFQPLADLAWRADGR